MDYNPNWSQMAHAAAGPNPRPLALALKDPARGLPVAAGTLLLAFGLKERGLLGCVAAVAGGALVTAGFWGVTDEIEDESDAPRAGEAEKQLAAAQGWKSAAVVSRAVSINRPRAELYAFWRDFANLPRFMENVKSIEALDDTRSRWTVAAPAGQEVTWVAVVTEDRTGERIAWEAAPGSQIRNAGWVEFADGPDGRGTEVRAVIAYEPPAGQAGRVVAKLLQREPQVQARRDLRRFKQIMEAGEIATAKAPFAAPRAASPVAKLREMGAGRDRAAAETAQPVM